MSRSLDRLNQSEWLQHLLEFDGINVVNIIDVYIEVTCYDNMTVINGNCFQYIDELREEKFVYNPRPVHNKEDNVCVTDG